MGKLIRIGEQYENYIHRRMNKRDASGYIFAVHPDGHRDFVVPWQMGQKSKPIISDPENKIQSEY